VGTLNIYESLYGLGVSEGTSSAWQSDTSRNVFNPWSIISDVQIKKSEKKTAKEVRRTAQAHVELAKVSEASTAAEFKRVTAWENRKQALRLSVGQKAERVRYDAGIAARLYEKIVAKLEAYSLPGKFWQELDQISKSVTAGLVEVSTVNLDTADLDQLGALDVEVNTAQWVVTEGRARLSRLNDKIDDEIKAAEARRQEEERASRAEARALEQAGKDAQLEAERMEFYAASARKTAELNLWVKLKDEIRREQRLLEQDLATLANLERGAR
jgi:hypothetical protein